MTIDPAREQRLAAQLRANLKRRKQAAHAAVDPANLTLGEDQRASANDPSDAAASAA